VKPRSIRGPFGPLALRPFEDQAPQCVCRSTRQQEECLLNCRSRSGFVPLTASPGTARPIESFQPFICSPLLIVPTGSPVVTYTYQSQEVHSISAETAPDIHQTAPLPRARFSCNAFSAFAELCSKGLGNPKNRVLNTNNTAKLAKAGP
jgi:hypothetical protein